MAKKDFNQVVQTHYLGSKPNNNHLLNVVCLALNKYLPKTFLEIELYKDELVLAKIYMHCQFFDNSIKCHKFLLYL